MEKNVNQPVVLTVAGFDPSGGAGVLADIKTFAAFGCYGLAAVTSLTFQNTRQVFGAVNQSPETVARQLENLFDDFEISAVKTGMLPTAGIIHEVARILSAKSVPIIVVDPVLASTSGFQLVDDRAVDAFTSALFPLASLVTPNIDEARRISGAAGDDQTQLQRAAEVILKTGACAVLVTGGDEDDSLSTDLLLDAQGPARFSSERIRSRHTHGTGCTLSSALTCLLARGQTLREAIPIAKEYLARAIRTAPGVGGGKGPLNHFPRGFQCEP